MQAVEEETGFRPTHYEIAVVPTLAVVGTLGDTTVDERYSPPFTFRLTRTELLIDAQLRHSGVKSVLKQVAESRRFDVLGLAVPLDAIRWTGLLSAAASAALAGHLVVTAYRRRPVGPVAAIRTRYGSVLVDVLHVAWHGSTPRLTLASFQDLARLAQREGGVVFHHQPEPEAHVYFVPDGGVIYEYRLGGARVLPA